MEVSGMATQAFLGKIWKAKQVQDSTQRIRSNMYNCKALIPVRQ